MTNLVHADPFLERILESSDEKRVRYKQWNPKEYITAPLESASWVYRKVLEEKFKVLKFPDLEKKIIECFDAFINLPLREKKFATVRKIGGTLCDCCMFISKGSSLIPFFESKFRLNQSEKKLLTLFLNHLKELTAPLAISPCSEKKVVIITDRNGGAHLAIAKSLKSTLSNRGFEVKCIKLHKIAEIVSPLAQMGMVFADDVPVTVQEAYNRFGVMNKNWEAKDSLDQINQIFKEQFPQVFAQNFYELLLQKIQQEKPAIIIHTLPYHDLTLLPYLLNIPMFIPQADYDFHEINAAIHKKQDYLPAQERMISFGLPSKQIPIKVHNLRKFSHPFHVVGYPIRPSFKPDVECDFLRMSLGIQQEDRLCVISMGRFAKTEHLQEAVSSLIRSPFQETMKVIVVCGENLEAKQQISEWGKTSKHILKVVGLLEEKEMAALFRIIREFNGVLWTKSGGSTIAEALAMGVKSLVFPGYWWENNNTDFVVKAKHGLKIKYENGSWGENPHPLIEQLLKWPPLPIDVVDWEAELPKTVENIIACNR